MSSTSSTASSSTASAGTATITTATQLPFFQADDHTEQRSRDVTGCMMYKLYSELERGGLDAVITHFQTACQAPDFISLCATAGFDQPSFHPNDLQACRPSYSKFQIDELDRGACLGVVFHGTGTDNIPAILQNGLDPQRRKGQAYGPGEYFSKDPAVSVGYCKKGLEMVVFVVVLPSTLATTESDKVDKEVTSTVVPGLPYLPPRHTIPPDYVVVENNAHQIPIGTLKFLKVNPTIMRDSQARRSKFLALSREVFHKSQISQEALRKAQIIQDLIANRVDRASERYAKHFGILSALSRKEISWYAHQKVDEDVVSFYFSDLPDPFGAEEIQAATVQSLDDATKNEEDAKQRLEAERQKDASLRANSNTSSQPEGTSDSVPALGPAPASSTMAYAASNNVPQLPGWLSSGLGGRGHTINSQSMGAVPNPLAGLAASNSNNTAQPLPGWLSSSGLSGGHNNSQSIGSTGAAAASSPLTTTTRTHQNNLQALSQVKLEHQSRKQQSNNNNTTPPGSQTQILQHLMANRVDCASELYKKQHGILSAEARTEISEFAHIHVDHSLVEILFPGLPPCSRKRKQECVGNNNIAAAVTVGNGTASAFESG